MAKEYLLQYGRCEYGSTPRNYYTDDSEDVVYIAERIMFNPIYDLGDNYVCISEREEDDVKPFRTVLEYFRDDDNLRVYDYPDQLECNPVVNRWIGVLKVYREKKV